MPSRLRVEHFENPKQIHRVTYLYNHGWKSVRSLQARYLWLHRHDISKWLNGGESWMRNPFRIIKLENGICAMELIDGEWYKSYSLTFEQLEVNVGE